MNPKVVTRFAPSPTGFLHVGSIRTAIYAWLFARQHGGTFILRIEDTDKDREVEGAIQHIIDSLQWMGIDWDEGPVKQSDRLDSYKKYAQTLIERGYAYTDPYTEAEVEEFRKKAEAEKRPFLYREYRPDVTEPWDGSKPLRFKVPEIKRYEWEDLARGTLSAGEEALDDFILIKSDGYPTYNFAHIVDDLEMGVTHIMRGEEFISSTPRFLSLYDALGIERPQIATLPVILGPDGKKKLSKRDGAKDVLDYRSEGYIPEALLNYLAFLGWHPSDDVEVMSVVELQKSFEVTRIQKGGAKFDETKLLWFNHEHLKRLSDDEFLKRLEEYMNVGPLPSYIPKVAQLLKERSQTLFDGKQAIETGEYSFMEDTIMYPADLLLQNAKAAAASVKNNLEHVAQILRTLPDEPFTSEAVKEAVFPYATEQGRAGVLWPMRVALSGKEKSPDPFMLASLIGKQKTLERIEKAAQML